MGVYTMQSIRHCLKGLSVLVVRSKHGMKYKSMHDFEIRNSKFDGVPVLSEYWSKTGIRKKYPSLKNYFGLHPHEGVPLGPSEAFLGSKIIFGSIAAVLNTVCWELRPNRVVVK
jgi:hypothetical protein